MVKLLIRIRSVPIKCMHRGRPWHVGEGWVGSAPQLALHGGCKQYRLGVLPSGSPQNPLAFAGLP